MTREDFMPNWKKQDQCFEEEQVEIVDRLYGTKIMKNGKPVVKAWPHDKPVAQISYENWLNEVTNPDTNEFYPARNKDGSEIKGTGAKHIVTQIIRLRRKDRSEYLITQGQLLGYNAFGNVIGRNCAKPEMWTRTLFNHERIYDQRTNSTKVQTTGTLGTEDVYEVPFNEKNLKQLFALRKSDTEISFTVKDEATEKAVSVRTEPNINDTLKMFMKPFEYLFNGDYMTPQQKAELRQQAIDAGLIAPSTPLVTESAPPKGTYA